MEEILDVTLIEPRLKHPTIFARFDSLSGGEHLTIYNDHDPKPLYYQLLGERGNIFTWEYLEQGPEWWKVQITRRKEGDMDETLGALAAKDLRKVAIFKKYGLDFCCGGKKTVKEACAEKGLDVTKIEQELQETDKILNDRYIPYNEWDPGFLCDYIINTHHRYVRKALPELETYAQKVSSVHASAHPELARVHELIARITGELTAHMLKEERILFPYIKELVSRNTGTGTFAPALGTVARPINMMEMEHELVAEQLSEIKALTNNYELPSGACASYSLLYRLLIEFEEDLHLHVHLENNILFPKAIALEKQMNAN